MMNWLEQTARNWLTARGYWVIKASVPTLVISYGVATFQKDAEGFTTYEVAMPPGHKLWAVNHATVAAK
jgi:hypothetical protein